MKGRQVLTLLILNDLASSSHLLPELPISSIPSHPLLHILKFSLDYLSTLQLSTHPNSLRIRQLLIRLVHTCVLKIRHSREFTKYIIQYHGILSTLIKIVEDVVSKMDKQARSGSQVWWTGNFGENTEQPCGPGEEKSGNKKDEGNGESVITNENEEIPLKTQ
ncbi:hypothetical protein WDU94_003400 [Cyamophila willieti]